MNNDEALDLLNLDNDADTDDALPDAVPFATPRPRRPWMLIGVTMMIIILATYVIVRTIGTDETSSVDIDLDAPVEIESPEMNIMPPAPPVVAPAPVAVAPTPQPAPAPAIQAVQKTAPRVADKPAQPSVDAPTRVIQDRADVKFNPDAQNVKPAPAPRVARPTPAVKPAPKNTPRSAHQSKNVSSIYVQFGSHSTRALAEAAERQLRAGHANLFAGHQFVILAAQVNGTTKYRLRIGFKSATDANGFCRNAKSDGVDCYVTK